MTTRRESDTRLYLHHCEQCGESRETPYADDDQAYCPGCSTHPLDHRIFRFWGDYDPAESAFLSALALLACVVLLLAFLAALVPY